MSEKAEFTRQFHYAAPHFELISNTLRECSGTNRSAL